MSPDRCVFLQPCSSAGVFCCFFVLCVLFFFEHGFFFGELCLEHAICHPVWWQKTPAVFTRPASNRSGVRSQCYQWRCGVCTIGGSQILPSCRWKASRSLIPPMMLQLGDVETPVALPKACQLTLGLGGFFGLAAKKLKSFWSIFIEMYSSYIYIYLRILGDLC